MQNNSEKNQLKNIKFNIKNEILLQHKLKNKLFVVNNVYPVSNILQNNNNNNNNNKSKKEYILDIKIKGKKNQDEELINYIKKLLYQYSSLIKFLSENFKQNNPLDISLYFTIDNKPILLVNNKGFHLIDFEALLIHSNRKITPNNFGSSFISNSKLF